MGLTVKDLIEALLDFPLDSEVCVENGYGEDSYSILSIFHDSEADMGYTIYDYVSIVCTNHTIDSDDYTILEHDFRGEWVNTEDCFEVYDRDNHIFYKVKFNKDTLKFEPIN